MAPLYDPARFESLEAYAAHLNAQLADKTADEIVQWAAETFGAGLVLSSSFGIQSAVMLHLVTSNTSADTRVPVVLIDTGYLPRETYLFAASLEKQMNLDVRVYQSPITPARMEALYGKLYEMETPEAHLQYGFMRKVEPMQRALQELGTTALLVGVRAQQTQHRQSMQVVNIQDGRLKICPILRWSKQDVDDYMARHSLPYHPLKAQGYESVGDWHSSRPVTAEDAGNDRAGRFHGKVQECGLHVDINMTLDDLTIKDDPLALEQQRQEQLELVERFRKQVQEPGARVIFTKPTCKYCLASKDVFRERGWAFQEVSVPSEVSIPALQALVGQAVKTVPQIYLDGEYVGGYSELVKHLGIPNKFEQ
jgi:phosphoadenosine phosphosulfate reductase